MALVAQNLTTRAHSVNLSFSAEKTDLIRFFKIGSSAKPKDISTAPALQTLLSTSPPSTLVVDPSEDICLLGRHYN
jgi:hypothetical protein